MSKTEFILEAKARTDTGKGASRRLRRLANEIPAIIYGAGKKPASITLRHDDIMHAVENEAFFSHILEINVEGSKESVIIKDLQRHPAKPVIMHADFLRVKADQELHVNIPLHFINEETCVGVKLEGGQISHLMNELEITCLPKNIPEYIEVDMLELHIGDSIHIADLALPEGVSSVSLSHGEEGNLGIVQVVKLKTREEEPEEGEAAAPESDAEESSDEDSDD
jgi:large subunit ribosomal protein L25